MCLVKLHNLGKIISLLHASGFSFVKWVHQFITHKSSLVAFMWLGFRLSYDLGSVLDWGTEILQATWCGQK